MPPTESPRVLMTARSIRDSEVTFTPEIAELMRRRDALNARQAAANGTANERAQFVQQLRERLSAHRGEFGSLMSVRPSLTASAIRNADFDALQRHEEACRVKTLEIERLELAMPVFEAELESARGAVRSYGPGVNALEEQIQSAVFAEKMEMARRKAYA